MSNSYRDIFKGMTIIGGASFIKLLISMVQTKFVAIFLGTFGVGLSHSYSNISGIFSAIIFLGLFAVVMFFRGNTIILLQHHRRLGVIASSNVWNYAVFDDFFRL